MMALNTIDIEYVLKKNITKKEFIGVFPSCEIPKSEMKRYFFITNSDTHDEPGSHWTAWMVENDKVEFFDSFGRSPVNYQMSHYYKHYVLGKKVSYSSLRVQNFSSKTCGYFCVFYVYLRCLGFDYEFIVRELGNLDNNDEIVVEFYRTLQ